MIQLLHDDTLGFMASLILLALMVVGTQGRLKISIGYSMLLLVSFYVVIGIHVAALAFGQLTLGGMVLDLFVLSTLTISVELLHTALSLQRRKEREDNNGRHV